MTRVSRTLFTSRTVRRPGLISQPILPSNSQRRVNCSSAIGNLTMPICIDSGMGANPQNGSPSEIAQKLSERALEGFEMDLRIT